MTKKVLLYLIIVFFGLGSFVYVMYDNLNKIKEYDEAYMIDFDLMVKGRRGKSLKSQTHSDDEIDRHSTLFRFLEEHSQNVDFLKDPFIKIALKVEPLEEDDDVPNFKLLGLSYDGDVDFAVINDTIVVVGQSIEGFEVIDIGENSVRLSDGENNIELNL